MALLSYDKAALARLCHRQRICRLSLFGSVLHGTDTSGSDIDLLVEFQRGAAPGLLGLAAIEAQLSELLGRPVDLRTPEELSRHFRQEVETMAEVQFAA